MPERTESGWYWTENVDGNMVGASALMDGRVAISLNGDYGHTMIFVRPSQMDEILHALRCAADEAKVIVERSTP